MSKTPVSKKGRTKKQLLLETSFKLFVEKGICDVSLEDILIESGVKKGNFYHYFESKDQLVIESLIECYHTPFYEWFEAMIRKPLKTRAAIENYFFNTALHMESVWQEIVNDPELKARDVFQMTREATRKIIIIAKEYELYDDRVRTWVMDLLKTEQDNGRFPATEDIHSICDFILSCCEGVYYRWIMNPNVDFRSSMQNVFTYIWKVIPLPPE